MEQSEVEKSCVSSDDAGLARSRSFKSKQLVRSQAIRESTSPPRTISPYKNTSPVDENVACASTVTNNITSDRTENVSDTSSHSDKCSVINSDKKCDGGDRKKHVEIQITSGCWEEHSEQRLRTRRWLGHRHHSDSSRDLLSYNPRITCVCGTCACPYCRGRRSKHVCRTKQDSGMCSDDCPDCSDTEHAGPNGDGSKKSGSYDAEEQVFYCRCPERKEKPKSTSLSRTDSEEKMEPTGPELVSFIKDTLNKNPRDRTALLKIEKELQALVNDTSRCIARFPVMTSYGRMLVHRCASLFQLAHHLDPANKTAVLVSKSGTSGGRLPCTSFKLWCTATFPRSPPRRHEDTLAKSILKREGPGAGAGNGGSAPRSKSLEQRERDYERVRRRIFSTDNCTQDESQWPWLNSGPVKVLAPEGGRNKLLKVQSLESRGGPEPLDRGPVSKSHSFGGYTAEPPPHRLLSRQGDLASSSWRLSPSSSGYKTLSLRSTDSVTPSPTGGASPELGTECATLVWAVTDMSDVPPGAVVIHPQTGRPLTNPDGSVYHFDPAHPPILYDTGAYAQTDHKSDYNNDKRRGKLEKQHSFIDNECDCQIEEYRKCCCKCRRQEICQTCSTEKVTTKETKNHSVQNSPIEAQQASPESKKTHQNPEPNQNRYEKQNHELTNQRESYESSANRNVYESLDDTDRIESTNQKHKSQNPTSPSNQRTFEPTKQRAGYEISNQRSFESTNQRPSSVNQRSFDSRQFEMQSVDSRVKVQGQECQEIQTYSHGIRNEEVSNYPQTEVAEVQNIVQAKVTPVPIPDTNIRPMSLTNMAYPAVVQQPMYPYVNHCRIEPGHLQPPMYQHIQPEEHKIAHTDNTFRIDASYPYAADFSAACGACVDPAAQQPRGYNMPYGPVEMPQVMPGYSVPNMMIQPPMQPYPQYQDAIQWQSMQQPMPIASPAPKLMVQELYPLIYPNVYPPYNIVYPQVVQQPYPVCPPMYPVVEKQADVQRYNYTRPKRNSLPNSSRNTPQAPVEEKKYEVKKRDLDLSRQNSNEIAFKIQQIKDQMTHLNTSDKDKGVRRDEWRRRNSGSGLLGSYPVNNVNGGVMGRNANEEAAQLSSAARAIVNSIRNIQAKSHYQDPRRIHDPRDTRDFRDRPRPRYDRATPTPSPSAGPAPDRRDVRRTVNPVPMYRAPYILRQMSPGTWCRRSPADIVAPVLNQPRRPHPDARNPRR